MTPPLHFRRAGPARSAHRRLHLRPTDRRGSASARAGRCGCTSCAAASFPQADASARAARGARRLRRSRPRGVPVIDGLALPSLCRAVAWIACRSRWIALIHHPLAAGDRPDAQSRPQAFADLERRVLGPRAARVVVDEPANAAATSRLTIWTTPRQSPWSCRAPSRRRSRAARAVPGLGAAVRRLAHAPQGSCRAARSARHGLRDLDRGISTCVGSAERDPACARSIAAAIDSRARACASA